jgi:carboxyl-terminal processing protease
MKHRLWLWGLLGTFLLGLGLGVIGGVVLSSQVPSISLPLMGIPANAAADFRLMAEAWNAIYRVYVDRPALQDRRLAYGSIAGMVDALGDTGHSRFLDPEMVQQQSDFVQGQFEGIGVYVEVREGHVVIAAPIDGSPAQQAGLRAGDIILKVNGENTVNLPLDQVRSRIVGPEGTSVTLTVLSPDTGQARDVTLVRARIDVHNVLWQRLPGTMIAHVRIMGFSQGVTQDLQTALLDIHQQELTGAILDLRNNPGGLLEEAVTVVSQFQGSGNALLIKDAQGETTPVPVKEGGVALDIPLVVLVNQGTASAAEIVAGALQDAGRARLVGETTFGTGTVLGEFQLSDGSVLLLAVEEWLTPAGRVIWHQGIVPDIAVTLPLTAHPLLPLAEAGMTPDQLRAAEDEQVLRALELLAPPDENNRTVTLDDDGGTIAVQTGERFLLKLGEDYDWAITIGDERILSRVVNVTVVRGAQGLYEAKQAGSTTLTATGDPLCRESQPPCAMPSRLFKVDVTVR